MANGISINTLLLAAGLSRRMGGINKLLIDIDGEPMVRKVAKLYCAISSSVTVVLGHEADLVAEALDGLDVILLTNPDYEKGRQSTARYGLEHLDITGDAVLIGLGDQHKLTNIDLRAFIMAFHKEQNGKIMIPEFEGQRGNPILFPADIARQLQADKKAPACRKYIDDHPNEVHHFETRNEHFVEDLDTPEDAERYGITIGST